ncbi:hypothetical protein HYX16_01015 [Candidatus Woesearchaeota archaeon]|nr:hypothetical protein [Candidatus Woesearchaeota archaeon]
MSLYDIFGSFESFGVFDIALPFILIFTVIFAVLQKIKLFGGKKNIDIIVAVVLAFLSVRSVFLVGLLNRFLPNTAIFLIIILMFLLMLGTFGGQFEGFKGYMIPIASIISLIFVVLALSGDFLGYGYEFILPSFLADLFYDYQTRATILFVAGMIIVIAVATSDSSSHGGFWNTINELGEKMGFKK